MKQLKIALTALLAVVLSACVSGYHDTKVINSDTGTQAAPKGPYQSLVVGVLVDHELRGHLEDAIVARFAEMGVKATAAYTVFGDKGVEGKSLDYLAKRMKENGFDSALAIHLEDQTTKTTEVKGDPGVSVPASAGMTMTPQVYSPDFYVNEDIYTARLELWDVDQKAIVWTGRTVSFNTGGFKGLEKGASHYAKTITDAISEAGIYQ
ncbi:MAG: hypothetical protein CL537_00130 [Alcanivoracaceae bacterium]|mgnify:CR=1 FL=1|nr:hypothetical protein [Alcanivoracaceae bacterium]|tara:strand:- start:128 stop:751 length:624 start_codon:yes stop_codon:yes gene_type:complete